MLFNQSTHIEVPNAGWNMSTDGEISGQNSLGCPEWKTYLDGLYQDDLGQVLIGIKLLKD